MSSLLIVLLVCIAVSGGTPTDPPIWPSTFTVDGTLSIPFAEIQEPFAAFFDAPNKRSRIDYYGGMMKTFQRGDMGEFGTTFKVVPITTEQVTNDVECFQVVSTSQDGRVDPQSVLPDLREFKFKGDDHYNGEPCERWERKEMIGRKMNKYTIWLKRKPSPLTPSMSIAFPLRYVMKGYNSLLGSHYDHYFIEYSNFSAESPDNSVFDVTSKYQCHGWPGPGVDHVYTMNPMKEFINNYETHVDATFDRFQRLHSKEYDDSVEREKRKDEYRQNMRFIHSTNRKGLSFKVAQNHMADWTKGEMRALRGKLYTPGYNGGHPFSYTRADVHSAPASLDWRLYGAVSPVKDQSVCGSCWSFGTVGTLEGTLFLQTRELTRLSQQALMDCSWGFGNNGCDGGEDFRVYKWMMKHGGIPTEDSYGPYLGADGYCHLNGTDMKLPIEKYVNVTSGDLDALKVALSKHGPISVSIDASQRTLSFYSSGIYDDPNCRSDPEGLDHSVLAVGYGEIMGQKYWLIKNSWSTYWGNDGYVLMSQKENRCGVATAPTFAVPK